tara:strand:- start:248 stop:1495 length:1248 start_codon:yes stop_codon:yes gene_type:complete
MATPSLALIPTGYKAGKLYSVLPESGVGDFDFTRASAATRVNSSGLIESVATGVPRLEYPLIDGVVNGCPSLLLENQATNLVTYNNDLTNANWITGQVTEVANDAISPTGVLDASKVSVTTVSNSHYFQQTLSIGENDVTISAYVKNIDANFIQVTNAGNALAYANFDIQNGTIGTKGSAISNQKIEKLPNDWYRISVTVDNTGFATTYMRFYIVTSASAPFNEFWLPTSTVSLNVWGVQCEIQNYATSIIPTQGSTITRVAEVCNNAGNSQVINSTEGVLYIETSALSNDLSERRFGLSDGTSSNVVRVGYTNVSNRIIAVIYNGSNQAVLTYTSPDITQNSKIAVKYKANDFALWVDGVERSTDISGTVFSANTLNSLDFNIGGGSHFYSDTKDVRVYNTALTDSELAILTTL